MPVALQKGNIDAFIASSPVSDVAVLQNDGVLWLSGPLGDFPHHVEPPMTSVLMTSGSFLDSNPDLVRRVQKALDTGSNFIGDHEEEAKAIVAFRFEDIDAQIFDSAWDNNSAAYTNPGISPQNISETIHLIPDELRTEEVLALDPADLVAFP